MGRVRSSRLSTRLQQVRKWLVVFSAASAPAFSRTQSPPGRVVASILTVILELCMSSPIVSWPMTVLGFILAQL